MSIESLTELAIVALTVALGHLALWAYLAFKKGIRKPSTVLLSAYLLLAAVWNLIVLIEAIQLIPQLVGFSWPSGYLYPLIPMAMLLWLDAYAFLQLPKPNLLALIPGLVVLILMSIFDANLIQIPPLIIPNTSRVIDNFSIVYWLALFANLGYIGNAAWLARKTKSKTESPRHRNRIQFFLLSLIIITLGEILFLSLAPLAQEIGLIIHWLGALFLSYLTLNQYLPDLKTSFKEFMGILIIGLFSIIIYAETIYLVAILPTPFNNNINGIAILSAVILTFLFLPLRKGLQNIVNRILFREQYNEKQIINDYIQTINNILLLDDLVDVSLAFITTQLNIKRGAYYLLSGHDNKYYTLKLLPKPENEDLNTLRIKKHTLLTQRLITEGRSISQYTLDLATQFSRSDTEAIATLNQMGFEQYVPIKRNEALIAILALGPFVSGATYNLQDIELLSTLGNQTAIALENARLFENVSQNLEEITRIKNLTDNVFASIESGVITVDIADRLVIINKAAKRILNLPPDIQPGSKIDAVLKQVQDTPLPALLRDVKSTQRSYHAYEIKPNIPNVGILNLSVDLSPIRDAQHILKGVALVLNDYTETKRLQVVQNLFRKYVSPAVVDRLPNDPTELKLGGHRQIVTVLFADIRGFTSFSEHQAPEDLINVLNKYLSMAAESILAYEGTLDKFMGDAVMAIFNAPLPQVDHTMRAVRAAAAMQQAIREFHTILGDYQPQLNFGVGIHVGEAVIGNVGTQARMDYTAVGDAVNLAKRIQENAPGGRILLSESAYNQVKANVKAIPHESLSAKGREAPEQTYELLNIK